MIDANLSEAVDSFIECLVDWTLVLQIDALALDNNWAKVK